MIFQIIIALLVAWLIYWLITTFAPEPIKKVLIIILVILVILFLCNLAGFLNADIFSYHHHD